MNWLCWHVGTATDPKLRIVAKRCGVSLSVAVHLWAFLLERGADATERGHLGALDPEDIAVGLDMEEKSVAALLEAMRDKGLISGESIANWSKRQHKTSTERVRTWRENKKQTQPGETLHETPAAVSETQETGETATDRTDRQDRQTKEQSRSAPLAEGKSPEPRIESSPPAPADQPDARPVIDLFDRVQAEIYGAQRRQMPAGDDVVFARRWLKAGADLELLGGLFRARLSAKRKAGEAAVGSLKFFDAAVSDAIVKSLTEIPAQFQRKAKPERPQASTTLADLDETMKRAGFGDAA